jgi:hypothetical protein
LKIGVKLAVEGEGGLVILRLRGKGLGGVVELLFTTGIHREYSIAETVPVFIYREAELFQGRVKGGINQDKPTIYLYPAGEVMADG